MPESYIVSINNRFINLSIFQDSLLVEAGICSPNSAPKSLEPIPGGEAIVVGAGGQDLTIRRNCTGIHILGGSGKSTWNINGGLAANISLAIKRMGPKSKPLTIWNIQQQPCTCGQVHRVNLRYDVSISLPRGY